MVFRSAEDVHQGPVSVCSLTGIVIVNLKVSRRR